MVDKDQSLLNGCIHNSTYPSILLNETRFDSQSYRDEYNFILLRRDYSDLLRLSLLLLSIQQRRHRRHLILPISFSSDLILSHSINA